ncbi:MAG TPA: DUF4190 domain-containing protein [Candidatus Bathyarchaeia archaeon]|nr:DUF4190 domain-containing protein [Candidatus Bathyarchaeia archaeon]
MAEIPNGEAEQTEAADAKAEDVRACPNRTEQIPNTADVCPHCGQSLAAGNGTAVASFVLGILSVLALASICFTVLLINSMGTDTTMAVERLVAAFMLCSLIFFPIAAIILGHRSLVKIRKSPVPMKGRGHAKAGLNMGCLSMVLAFIAAITIPGLLRSSIQVNESAAIGNIRMITGAQTGWSSGGGPYAVSFAQLTDTTNGPAFLLGEWRNGMEKDGYIFTMKGVDLLNGFLHPSAACYETTASPAKPGRTGVWYFFSDCSGVIRASVDGPADSTSRPIGE